LLLLLLLFCRVVSPVPAYNFDAVIAAQPNTKAGNQMKKVLQVSGFRVRVYLNSLCGMRRRLCINTPAKTYT
jgi:hypothetical protein